MEVSFARTQDALAAVLNAPGGSELLDETKVLEVACASRRQNMFRLRHVRCNTGLPGNRIRLTDGCSWLTDSLLALNKHTGAAAATTQDHSRDEQATPDHSWVGMAGTGSLVSTIDHSREGV
jgi:hypothetical protein